MSKAITRSILARKMALALQEETLAEINTIGSRIAPNHARRRPSDASKMPDMLSLEYMDESVLWPEGSPRAIEESGTWMEIEKQLRLDRPVDQLFSSPRRPLTAKPPSHASPRDTRRRRTVGLR